MTGDNLHPSTAGDLLSRSSCYPHPCSESDYSASVAAAAAVVADTVVAAEGGSKARTADCTSYAAASPWQDTA